MPAAHSGVDVAESDRVFALHAVYSHSADSPYAYKRDVKLAVGRFCRGYRESRQYERRRSSGSDILYEFSSIHFFPFFYVQYAHTQKERNPPSPQALKKYTNDSPLGYRLFNIENAAKNKGQAYLKTNQFLFKAPEIAATRSTSVG